MAVAIEGGGERDDGSVEVICAANGCDLLRTVPSGTVVLCRFTVSESLEEQQVPASLAKQRGRHSEARCRCNAKLLEQQPSVSIVLPTGERIVCQASIAARKSVYSRLSFLDRYLFVWILIVMVAAILLGYFVKDIKKKFQVSEVASVSLPIAVGLWAMMYPVLCKVQYELLGRMLRAGGLVRSLSISFLLNWLLCPALMTGLAWATLPDLPSYRRGVILVGIARCIAMVLVWNDLAKGDGELCAVIVAFNSVLQIALYGPLALFYLKVVAPRGSQGIDISTWQVGKSVLVFLGGPLAAAVVTRASLCFALGRRWYNSKLIPLVAPLALIGLLFTVFVLFSIQAHQIISNFGKVVRVAVPLVVYFAIVFTVSVGICILLKIPYPESVTQSFTATSNNFELAIAVAVAVFGVDSSEALAATIGPLMEVPILLALVYVMLYLKSSKYFARVM